MFLNRAGLRIRRLHGIIIKMDISDMAMVKSFKENFLRKPVNRRYENSLHDMTGLYTGINSVLSNRFIDTSILLKIIKPGDRIFITSGPAIPAYSVMAITASDRMHGLDLEIIQLFTVGNYFRTDSSGAKGYRVKTFSGPADPDCENINCMGDIIPANVTEIPFLFTSKAVEIDIAIIATTPPDENGYVSTGVAADVAERVIKKSRIAIAEVNSRMPFTLGSTLIKAERFNYIIESNLPIPEKRIGMTDPVTESIGENISRLIRDGSTVMFHTGAMTCSVAQHLSSRKKLGILTNEVSDWVIPLVDSQVISDERECYEGGRVSASYCYGSKKLYSLVHRNPLFGFYPISKLVEMSRFNDITNLISIMTVEKIDLTVENVLTCSGDNILSGYANRFNFIPDISFTENCSVILALKSTDREGKSSIIISGDYHIAGLRPTLSTVRFAVTEFGIAKLLGKTVRERALAMIEIAHPDHREQLFNEAKNRGYIDNDHVYAPIGASYPSKLECRKIFKGNLELHIRPVRASDEDMMRSFFYKFSDDSRFSRFFSSKAVMTHRSMQQYLNVDYENIVSLIAIHKDGYLERIVAEARYAVFRGRDVYEMAFLVDEEFQGYGIGTFMAEYLVKTAKSRGIRRLNASVLSHNVKMLSVLDRLGLPSTKQIEDDIIEISFSI